MPNREEVIRKFVDDDRTFSSIAAAMSEYAEQYHREQSVKLEERVKELEAAMKQMLDAFDNAPQSWLMTNDVQVAESKLASLLTTPSPTTINKHL